MKRSILLLAVAVGLLAGWPSAHASTTYRPGSYEAGPRYSGPANRTSHIEANKDTGKVTVLWANATPGAIGCPAYGGFAYLRVAQAATGEVLKRAMVAYSGATLSQYAWLKVNVFEQLGDTRTSIGSLAVRGQKANERGTLVVPLDRTPVEGSTMFVDFGIETGSACPNADGGTVVFDTVAIN